jgi:BON domain
MKVERARPREQHQGGAMRPTFLFAICLLGTACAHSTSTSETSAREPGTIQLVPVVAKPLPESQTPAGASTAALVQKPELTSDPKPSSDPLVSPTADAAGEPVTPAHPPTGEEVQLRERIQAALGRRKSLSYTAQHVSVEVDKADVTLQGDVRTAREKAKVQSIVEQIQGVRRVHNRLAVIDERMMPAPDAVR